MLLQVTGRERRRLRADKDLSPSRNDVDEEVDERDDDDDKLLPREREYERLLERKKVPHPGSILPIAALGNILNICGLYRIFNAKS